MSTKSTRPLYSKNLRKKIISEIKWADGANKDQFFIAVEELGRNSMKAIANEMADPRIAANVLNDVVSTIRDLEKKLERMDQIQACGGGIRQIVSIWSRSPSGDTENKAWDDLDDARGLMIEFADEVETSLARFRKGLGRSREHPDKEVGWAIEIWRQYRRIHAGAKIGKRPERPGPFRRVLELLAEPLSFEVNWSKVERHLRRLST